MSFYQSRNMIYKHFRSYCAFILSMIVIFNQNVYPDIKTADSLYEQRGINYKEVYQFADSKMINEAIKEYRNMREKTNDTSIEWKLMRALYFKGYYTKTTQKEKKDLYNEAIKIGLAAIKKCPTCIETFTWLAIVQGEWSQEYGIMRSAYEGVAAKIRNYSKKVISLDTSYFDGAGFRILGRLNFLAPKVPVILPWPSKKNALVLLKRSYLINPNNTFNCQYYAEALYEQGEHQKAIEIAQEALQSTKYSNGIVEDSFTKRNIIYLLKQWK